MLNFDDVIPLSCETSKYGKNFCYISRSETPNFFLNLAFNFDF